MTRLGPAAAQVEVCIDGAQQDVGHVERPERPFLEDGGELVAVPTPKRRDRSGQERDRRWRLAEASQAELREVGQLPELVGEHGGAQRGEPIRAPPLDGLEGLDQPRSSSLASAA